MLIIPSTESATHQRIIRDGEITMKKPWESQINQAHSVPEFRIWERGRFDRESDVILPEGEVPSV